MAASTGKGPAPATLRAAGMRQTPQREAILRILAQSERALSAVEIQAAMEARGSGLPTIYRNLERFEAEGWVECIPGADQVMRFVRCSTQTHHHHVQCEQCHRVVEIASCGVEAAVRAAEQQSGFLITDHLLLFRGLCQECRGASHVDIGRRPASI